MFLLIYTDQTSLSLHIPLIELCYGSVISHRHLQCELMVRVKGTCGGRSLKSHAFLSQIL